MSRRFSVAAIVVAAGRSKRMGRLGDKVWIRIAGRPVLFYSLTAFVKAGVRRIVVVTRPEETGRVRSCLKKFQVPRGVILEVAPGGRERQDSVWEGLQSVGTDLVLVHDASRPAVSPSLIREVCKESGRSGACVPVVPLNDTLKRVAGRTVLRTESRSGLYGVQTPQGFRRDWLRRAIETARRRKVLGTDCSALVELLGKKITTVPGDPANLKLTRPADLKILHQILESN